MIKLTVNGEKHELLVPEDMPLLWVVRDVLKLKGSKFGCGAGHCGACTMHVNGRPIRTCVTPIKNVDGKEITTIEGLGDLTSPSSVQKAWTMMNVPQCGYCQSGQIMSATALLSSNASPTDKQIDKAMSGNICRCGTYPRIREAVRLASDLMAEE